jgi:hypothetical protein
LKSKEARENTGILVIFVGEVKIALRHRFLRVFQENKDNQTKAVLH